MTAKKCRGSVDAPRRPAREVRSEAALRTRVVARVDDEQLIFLSLAEATGLPRLPLALESGKMQTVMLLTLGKDRVVFAIDEVVWRGERDLARAVGR